jgi:hypothetical protein
VTKVLPEEGNYKRLLLAGQHHLTFGCFAGDRTSYQPNTWMNLLKKTEIGYIRMVGIRYWKLLTVNWWLCISLTTVSGYNIRQIAPIDTIRTATRSPKSYLSLLAATEFHKLTA